MAKVMILMGSESDKKIMQKAHDFLIEHHIESEMHVASAHRNPERVHKLAKEAEETCQAVIAGAGMAAHLGGVLASLVTIPVIGVPINASMNGLDSLLSIAQMPPGIPVATVAINGAKNAAILAMEIIALSNKDIKASLLKFRESMNQA